MVISTQSGSKFQQIAVSHTDCTNTTTLVDRCQVPPHTTHFYDIKQGACRLVEAFSPCCSNHTLSVCLCPQSSSGQASQPLPKSLGRVSNTAAFYGALALSNGRKRCFYVRLRQKSKNTPRLSRPMVRAKQAFYRGDLVFNKHRVGRRNRQ